MTTQLLSCDFLSQSKDEKMQQEARNILSSYSQVHDVLAEGLQNAVDAIEDRYQVDSVNSVAKIRIVFNVYARTISITDTGTGMPWEILQNALVPNITYKAKKNSSRVNQKRSRGEKGVGLSFLTFACNEIRVKSCNGEETVEGIVSGANDWIHEHGKFRPMLKPTTDISSGITEELGSTKYTSIKMSDIRTKDYSEEDIFDYSLPQLKYILRTKTAIGNTSKIISDVMPEPLIKVELIYIDGSGINNTENIPYEYLTPEGYLSESSIITFENFEELLMKDKLHMAQGKALVYRRNHTTSGGREIGCYAFAMAPKAFDDITKDLENAGGWSPSTWSGIYIATRDMPTGITIDHPVTYSAGYWQRVFMLLQDDQMNFDVGRKSLQGQAKPMMQGIAKAVWDDIFPYLQKLTPADPDSVVRQNERDRMQLFMDAAGWANLNVPQIQYLKQPQREQMVVALFYELIGAGLLKGYKTMRNNTYDQYDAFVLYEINKREIGRLESASVKSEMIRDNIVIEFKLNAKDIIKDILTNTKRYRDIQLLVCWDLQGKELESLGISVEPISPDSIYYYGSTHKLFFPGMYRGAETLTVIELKTFIDKI